MLDGGRDDSLLRFSLGNALLAEKRAAEAVVHLLMAVEHDPGYSAAWKLLGKAQLAAGNEAAAADAYRAGIDAARSNGDQQAMKEMQVFLRRLKKDSGN
ncbi:MAG: hypothetical protein O6931_00315 [Gammaproteobacteria bacterium]|nr:hypothetical protein [Gammaproteobacteria bacterium]